MQQSHVRFRAVFVLLLTTALARGGVDVLTYHNDNARTGDNLSETILTPANVNANSFGKLFAETVDGDIYTQPLYVSGLSMPHVGTHNVVFVATEHNSVYAFDADNGQLLWHVNLGPSVTTPNPEFGNRYGGFNEIAPEVGITGTPVINLSSQTLYVDAFTHESQGYLHRIHALNINTGAERPFSPVVVSATFPGLGVGGANGQVVFNAEQQLQRCALTIAGGNLYVPYTGYADSDPYHGWILGFNPANLQLLPNYIFNTTPNSTTASDGDHAGEAGIWMGGGGLAVDAGGNIFFATGNGSFNALNGSGGTEYGDSFLKLSTVHGLAVADYFTPWDQMYWGDNDLDTGSGGLLVIPDQSGPVPHLMVGGGKPGLLYVINRDQFTAGNNHYNANGITDAVQQTIALTGGNFSTAAYFNKTIYITAANSVPLAFSVANGMLSPEPISAGTRKFPFPGATASVSASGNNNAIVWMVERANPATLVAYNANDLSSEIYNSDQSGARDQLPAGVKFAVPTVAGGKVYVGGHSTLTVFGLLPPNYPPAGTYNGLFYGAGGAQIGQSGFVTVTANTKGKYTGHLQLASGQYSFSGQFDNTGASTASVKISGSPSQIQLQYDGSNPPQLTGNVGNGSWNSQISAAGEIFNARTNPAPFAGKYTLVIHGPGGSNPQEPQGDGFGTVTISTAGQLKFQGTLADGTAVSQSAGVFTDGEWPFFAPLYAGRGQILGWVDFASTAQSDLSATLTWTKLATANAKTYPAGFNLAPALEGSRYPAPANASVLDFNTAVLTLNGPAFASGLVNDVTVNPKGSLIASNQVTLKFNPSSGMLTGSVPNPAGGHALSINAMFLPKENWATGYFLNSGVSGEVSFGPQ